MNDFPVTDWQRMAVVRSGDPAAQHAALEELLQRYRPPILAFLLRKGYDRHRAEDITQDFFMACLTDGVFEKADAARGRFRNLLLAALTRHAAKRHRHEHAQKRRPEGGFAEPTAEDGPIADVAVDGETPERSFERAWARALLSRVVAALEAEYGTPARKPHWEIFRRCMLAPVLENAPVPAYAALGQEFGLTEKEVGNRLGTAKRAYERLLRAEVATYARSDEEIDEEIRALRTNLQA